MTWYQKVPKKLKEKLTDLFIRGRKQSISTIFISQSFYEIPKIIRSQANYYIIKSISSKKDLNLIISDVGLQKDEVGHMIDQVLESDERNFIMIDKKSPKKSMRYRINFDPIEWMII